MIVSTRNCRLFATLAVKRKYNKMAESKIESTITFLDYLKVFLTGPVLFSLVFIIFIFMFREDVKALLLRISKIKLPGGAEVSTAQSARSGEESPSQGKPVVDNNVQITGLPDDLNPQQKQSIEQLVRSHISTAYLWEYRFLNYHLVRGTQLVFDWLAGLPQATTYSHYDSVWLPIIPSANERQAIINTLQAHHLIQCDTNGLIIVSDKGREYLQWRGALPPLTNAST